VFYAHLQSPAPIRSCGGVDLISNALPFGRLRYDGPNAISTLMDDLQQTLDKFSVPAAEQAELKAIVNSTYGDIVVGKSDA